MGRLFVAADGTIYPVQYTFKRESLQAPEMGTLEKLARALRSLAERMSKAEADADPGYIEYEFEYSVLGPNTVSLEHNMGVVRWWIVDFVGAAAPAAWKTTASTDTTLVIQVSVAGKYVFRVAPAGTEGV